MKTLFKVLIVSWMLTTAWGLSGCGTKSSEVYSDDKTKYDETPMTEEQTAAVDQQAREASVTINKDAAGGAVTPPNPQVTVEQIPAKIIKSGDISFQVENYKKSRTNILGIVNKFGARVTTENQTNIDGNLSNTMTIRVEGSAFDSLVEALMKEAIFVDHMNINAQDVTEEYVDLQARLKSKKDLEAQYVEILKKATTINEILEVQQYLGQIREEIESFEGRLKYMEDRVAHSTITLTYYEKLDVVDRAPDRSFGSRLGEAFGWGWSGLVKFFLGLIYTWPIWVILGFGAWLTVFLVKRAKRKHKKNSGPVA